MSVTITLGSSSLEITANPSVSNSTELIPKRNIAGVYPFKFQTRQSGNTDWVYPYNTMSIITLHTFGGRKLMVELQDVTNQPTWSTGTLAGQKQAIADINAWLKLSAPFAYQPETINYLTAISVPNDGTVYFPATAYTKTGADYWSIIDNYFLNMKGIGPQNSTQNLLPLILGVYPYISDTFANVAINAVNPVNSDAAFRLSFIQTSGSGSILGDGIHINAGYLGNTHFVPGTIPLGSTHISCYSNFGSANYLMGTFEFLGCLYIRRQSIIGITSDNSCNSAGPNSATESGGSFIQNNRISTTEWKRFNNGAISDTVAANEYRSGLELYLWGLNNNGTPGSSSSQIYKYHSFGYGMTDVQASVHNTIVVKLQTDLIRP